jgi:hypothetical protein
VDEVVVVEEAESFVNVHHGSPSSLVLRDKISIYAVGPPQHTNRRKTSLIIQDRPATEDIVFEVEVAKFHIDVVVNGIREETMRQNAHNVFMGPAFRELDYGGDLHFDFFESNV